MTYPLTGHAGYPALYCDPILRFRMTIVKRTCADHPAMNSSVKLALERKIAGALIGPSAYFMKTPPQQMTDNEARRLTEEFIAG